MTRINTGIEPEELDNDHLLAEHREIKRIPNAVRSGKAVIKDIPKRFTLNKGHVKFFYDKLEYLRNRYECIYQECIHRGFKVTYYGEAWKGIPPELMGSYTPSKRDRAILIERLREKRPSYVKLN